MLTIPQTKCLGIFVFYHNDMTWGWAVSINKYPSAFSMPTF